MTVVIKASIEHNVVIALIIDYETIVVFPKTYVANKLLN